MTARKKTVREIPFSQIEGWFQLGAYFWFDGGFQPAVIRKGDGWRVRVVASETRRGADTTTKWDYFELDADGTVVVAPRGYAKDFKPGRVTGLDEALRSYAVPKGDEPRLGL